jgi:hypothetical protein
MNFGALARASRSRSSSPSRPSSPGGDGDVHDLLARVDLLSATLGESSPTAPPPAPVFGSVAPTPSASAGVVNDGTPFSELGDGVGGK